MNLKIARGLLLTAATILPGGASYAATLDFACVASTNDSIDFYVLVHRSSPEKASLETIAIDGGAASHEADFRIIPLTHSVEYKAGELRLVVDLEADSAPRPGKTYSARWNGEQFLHCATPSAEALR